jgi:ABC-type nitrate/sulfonate/bicarbonate transport system ATPase subunit
MQGNSKNISLEIKNLSVRYGSTSAVDNFNLTINNETLVLFGPSGCGKTTILKSILGIKETGKKENGEILLSNVDLDKNTGDVGMTFQGPVLPNWLKVGELCSLGSKIRNLEKEKREEKIKKTLRIFNVARHIDKYPSELSGGEKQRIALAITIINEPKMLLLDEPTTFIDGATRMTIWKHLENHIRPLNIPTIIVSHDPFESIMLSDRIIILGDKAHILKVLDVPFEHPRTESLFKIDEFWELKKTLDKH